jgi:hypothetical protein
VLTRQGSGFSAPVSHPTGASPGAVVVGSFDGTPGLDLAVANNGSGGKDGGITLLSGEPDAGFVLTAKLHPELSFGKLATADLDADGTADLVGVQTAADRVSLFLQDAGSFGAPLSFPTGREPSGVAILDVNGDLRPDLVITNQTDGTLTVLINDCTD